MEPIRQNYVIWIEEMDCNEEVTLLKKELSPLIGGEEFLFFDLINRKLTIKPGPINVPLESVVTSIKKIGMTPNIKEKTEKKEGAFTHYLKHILVTLSALFTLTGFFLAQAHFPKAAIFSYGIAIMAGGRFVFPRAYTALKNLNPDMNLLMTIAVIGAISLGDWLEAATVTFLFSLSLFLESWSVARASKAIEALLELAPDSIRVLLPGNKEDIAPAKTAAIGTIYRVKPGEKISLDGIVVNGITQVNQAPITGESLPVPKKEKDFVFAGSINGDGVLDIQSTATFDQSTLSKMIRLINEAHLKRSPSDQWVEKFSRVYTPMVIGLAILILFIPPMFFEGNWFVWLYRSLVLLVIACPCALVISTPVSIVSALTCGARNGVLIKGGKFIELPAQLKAIAFDKTGTLTKGELSVRKLVCLEGFLEEELLQIAATLACKNEHPASKAVCFYANSKNITPLSTTDYQSIPGKGALAKIKGRQYWLGSHNYLEERGLETPEIHQEIEALNQKGHTIIAVGNEFKTLGFLALSDSPRPQSKEIIQQLKKIGIQTIMLTGDNSGSAKKIAQEVGIEQIYSDLLPQEKVQKIEELVKKIGIVAMIGDGVNDAPAMARASMGIAMGVVGSDASIEIADIALMSDDLSKIPWLISHSKRTVRIIRQNIVFSIVIKVVFMILIFLGYATMWGAIIADTGASLLVIFNGLRLLR